MDTATRTWTRRIAASLLVLVAAIALGADRPAPARPALTVYGADAEEQQGVGWAFGRFEAGALAGLQPLEVYLHTSKDDCKGALGRYRMGRVDLCTKESSEKYAKKYALHEMAHAWVETNVDAGTLERFMELRGVEVWNDPRFPWKERGSEQAAEIITWGLGEGDVVPLLPELTDAATLAELYELLTGRAPITPEAGI